MSRLEARALLDDGMKAFASLLKLKKLTPTNASHIFRRRLDKGVKKEELPSATAPKERIQADDNRRNGVLDTLLRGLVTELETLGAEGSLVPENYTAALHNSLTTILASKETMAMLSSRNHSIRIDGNDSAHAAHSVESLTLMQVRITKDDNHPLPKDSKVAVNVLAQLFIDVPCLLPTALNHPGSSTTV